MTRKAVVVLVCGTLMLILAMGIRQSFGIFLMPISMDLGTGRQVIGLAIALQNLLWGLAQPVVGLLADRWGATRVGVTGGVAYVAGLVLATVAADPVGMQFTLGALVGLALSGTTYATVLGAVGKVVPPERRTIAFGVCTAAGSFGMFAVVPGAQGMLDSLGWAGAFLVMAAAAALLVPLALGLRVAPPAGGGVGFGGDLRRVIRVAAGHRDYWLLNGGFFVCGFHVAFIAAHLPAYLADRAMPVYASAWSLAMIGLGNIVGSYLFGLLGARHSPKLLLSGIYAARSAVILAFILAPLTPVTAIAFGGAMGFLWLGTVPLTSGLVARFFGVRYLSMLYGFVFMFHQIGAFLGAWGGGWAYDALGSYDLIWMISIALGLIAAVLHLPIREVPAAELKEQPA
ncbi:MAG TPA: MFS transporter [Azospirillaceae bacterium]|nr:MFS transporter [Azospirillaceae bacterium]